MARLFNGTSDAVTVPLVFNGSQRISISYWGLFPAQANSDLRMVHVTNEASVGANGGFDHNARRNSVPAGSFCVGMTTAGNQFYEDGIVSASRPSDGIWHHILVTHDRATPLNAIWVDGVAQSLTSVSRGTCSGGFSDNLLTFGKYSSTFLNMRIADWAIWNGIIFRQGEASVLARNGSPLRIRPDRLLAYLPFDGAAGNRERVFGRMGAPIPNLVQLTGTTAVASPFGYRAVPRGKVGVFA